MSRILALVSRRRVLAVSIVALLGLAATTVGALSARGSREFTQSTNGVAGTAETGDYFGVELAVGDFDGDGFGDVVAAAPYEDLGSKRDAGQVQVLYGASGGVTTAGDDTIHQGTSNVAGRSVTGDLFGSALAAVDVDGDGHDDLAAAAPGETIAEVPQAGLVHIFAGSPTGIVVEGNVTIDEGSPGVPGVREAYDRFGVSLDGGDFDGGGVGDLAIGIAGESRAARTSSGAVVVLPGAEGTGITGAGAKRISQAKGVIDRPEAGDDFGYRVAVGDFNGNGRDDLAVGAPGETVDGVVGAGATHVFFGRPAGISTRNDELWQPGLNGLAGVQQANAGAGRSLATGDINGDGRDDLVIGVPGRTTGTRNTAGSFVVLYG